MTPRERPVERLRIESISSSGEGVGRTGDGKTTFVHRTAPGEEVEVELTRSKRRWARARLLRVVSPSPDRRDPPCPHYLDCGGCTLEHLSYGAQLAAKRRIVSDALRRIGGLEATPSTVVASPREFRYRNRVSFSLRRLDGSRVVAGFHALNDPDRIVSIDGSCLLPEEPISRVWDELRRHWGAGAARLPRGRDLRLTLRTTSSGEVSLLIEGGAGPGDPETLLNGVPGLTSIWHRPGRSRDAVHLAGARGLLERWGDETFEVSGTAFLQVNRPAAKLLEDHVLASAGDVDRRRVIDAYCGVGSLGRQLAARGASVVGIELDGEAVRVATAMAPPSIRILEGRVEDHLAAELPADLLILNPPRSGIDSAVVAAILSKLPGRIAYVSCDPATLARDLSRLTARYHVTGLTCFDLFPQTSHVETVAELSRAAPTPAP